MVGRLVLQATVRIYAGMELEFLLPNRCQIYNKSSLLFYRLIKILLPTTDAERCTNAHF